jgi:predicted short-subunit dehydrogenase-like oxidoreductase (DUF2520 family)
MTPTLNIIGCGKVGRVLGRLWAASGVFELRDILNRTRESAARAVGFIGAGRATTDYAVLRPAEVWMIGVPDDAIGSCCERLAAVGHPAAGNVVFHCSGAQPAAILAASAGRGASIASAHPVASFADADAMIASFAGTFCCVEGNADAVRTVAAAFGRIGARILEIDGASKLVYHAGSVFAASYLVTLLEVALQTYEHAGIPRATALELMQPLVHGSVANVFGKGTAKALSGPIVRSDFGLIARQQAALDAWNEPIGELYRRLAEFAAKLAQKQSESSGTEQS